ncbi:MAG: hydroxymethylglutaryl-CoA lyase [Kordiimonas sp.]|nr:hydroxymethylglutaryl-CoA lyase [Kordiimonas sp.]|tara:strand:+ start:1101 stop:2006 length:906 start_codon:yes stop_codon:yes gene_type:complete
MHFPKSVRLYEVGPRDGLQNEPEIVPTAVKIDFIERLVAAGLRDIDVTSFVSPKWVPQMADHGEVMEGITRKADVSYSALVPNMRGLEGALRARADEVGVFVSATEEFSQKNINCSIGESFQRLEPVVAAARAGGVRVRGYVSCVLGCPYAGDVVPAQVVPLAKQLFEMGCYEVSLGDTVGVGTALQVQNLVEAVGSAIPVENIALHLHDTYGQAIANAFAGLQMGIRVFDSSVAGLGGCPFAKGASGNMATEDMVYLCEGLGIETGVDMAALLAAGRYICAQLERPPMSKVALALNARRL